MKTIKLTKQEKDEIKNLSNLLDKRNTIQNKVIARTLENTLTKKYIWALHPRAGKSYCILKLIKLYNNKFGINKMHLIATPSTHIKEEFEKLFNEFGVSNVVVTTCQGYFSKRFQAMYADYSFAIVCLDEGDFGVSSASSIKWSNLLNIKSKHLIAMSGTFSEENVNFLEQHKFDTIFNLDIDDGGYMKTLPSFTTYNLGVDLTSVEQEEYYRLHCKMEVFVSPYRQVFTNGNWANYAIAVINNASNFIKIDGVTKKSSVWLSAVSNATKIPTGVLLGYKKRYRECQDRMNSILENAENKLSTIVNIVDITDDKGITFTTRKETCNALELLCKDIIAYHSDSNESALKDFIVGNKKNIVSIGKLSRGFTNAGIMYAINSSYNSTSNGYVQKISRALSLDESDINKKAKIINLYCKKFKFNETEITTKDYVRLLKSQKDAMVEWINFVDEI